MKKVHFKGHMVSWENIQEVKHNKVYPGISVSGMGPSPEILCWKG
ncbi:hypothetical protein [Flagellimonas algicola]|nr:hypothetical protein [Allomuricauda algicola]